MKNFSFLIIILFGLPVFSETAPKLQLAHRIEIKPDFSGKNVELVVCDFWECKAIGKESYSHEEMQKISAKNKSADPSLQIILRASVATKRPQTFALLSGPFDKGGKKMNAAIGYGGSAFAFMFPLRDKNSKKEADYILELNKEVATNFRFLEGKTTVKSLKEDLEKLLKSN